MKFSSSSSVMFALLLLEKRINVPVPKLNVDFQKVCLLYIQRSLITLYYSLCTRNLNFLSLKALLKAVLERIIDNSYTVVLVLGENWLDLISKAKYTEQNQTMIHKLWNLHVK